MSAAFPYSGQRAFWREDDALCSGVLWADGPENSWWVTPTGGSQPVLVRRYDLHPTLAAATASLASSRRNRSGSQR